MSQRGKNYAQLAQKKRSRIGLFDYRQNSIHQFVLKREPCCIIDSYKYKLRKKKPGIQVWGRTSGNVIYSQIRKDNRNAFSFHLTRELIMSITNLSVGSASRHAEQKHYSPEIREFLPSNMQLRFFKYENSKELRVVGRKRCTFKWLIPRR